MKNVIKNKSISFLSDSFNVEPWSLHFNDEEINYFWRPPHVEKLGTAVCFPLMGMLPDGKYIFDGKEYTLGMHGFAQDREFVIAERNETHIVYELVDDKESYAHFPWRFRFSVGYALEGDTLKTEYRIENRDEKEMFFTVGGHPRYACPVLAENHFEDYHIEFEKPESAKKIYKSYGPVSEIEKCFSPDGRRIKLDYRMFTKGCFCLPLNSTGIRLKSDVSGRGLFILAEGAVYLQFWTEPGAPFLCIEPIYGSTSHLPFKEEDRDWKNREGTLHIKAGETFSAAYYVTFLR
jgi:galactose mutarotase-like enzyme